jgi:N-acetyl-anhydromuramyl-L-alanine amidase AmpD
MTIRTLGYWLVHRSRKRSVSCIVLHATAGGSALSSIGWLRRLQENQNPKDDASYHYVISHEGIIYKCCPTGKVAYHAGVSVGPEGANVNEYSIGIAFANNNAGEQITNAQIEACKELIADLRKAIPSLHWLTTHYALTVKPDGSYRKSDPRGFDHMQYVANGLTLWKPSYSKTFALD